MLLKVNESRGCTQSCKHEGSLCSSFMDHTLISCSVRLNLLTLCQTRPDQKHQKDSMIRMGFLKIMWHLERNDGNQHFLYFQHSILPILKSYLTCSVQPL